MKNIITKLTLIFAVVLASGCTTITVSSPSGCAVAKYTGTTLIGDEVITCVDGPTSGCTVGGQNSQQLIATVLGALAAGGVIAGVHPKAVAPTPSCHQTASK